MMTEKPNGRAAKRQYWQQMVNDWELGHFKTQKEFCQHAGISYKSLSRWRRMFSGERQLPKPAMAFSTVHVRNELANHQAFALLCITVPISMCLRILMRTRCNGCWGWCFDNQSWHANSSPGY